MKRIDCFLFFFKLIFISFLVQYYSRTGKGENFFWGEVQWGGDYLKYIESISDCLPAQFRLIVDFRWRSFGLAAHGGHDTHVYRYAAQQIHNEEQQEDSSHSDAHNGGRGEYLTVGNLNHIDTCAQ